METEYVPSLRPSMPLCDHCPSRAVWWRWTFDVDGRCHADEALCGPDLLALQAIGLW